MSKPQRGDMETRYVAPPELGLIARRDQWLANILHLRRKSFADSVRRSTESRVCGRSSRLAIACRRLIAKCLLRNGLPLLMQNVVAPLATLFRPSGAGEVGGKCRMMLPPTRQPYKTATSFSLDPHSLGGLRCFASRGKESISAAPLLTCVDTNGPLPEPRGSEEGHNSAPFWRSTVVAFFQI